MIGHPHNRKERLLTKKVYEEKRKTRTSEVREENKTEETKDERAS